MTIKMELIVELIKLGSVGILSGIFSAIIALRRYRHEKWWEMRVDAYRSGIEALSDLVIHYELRLRNWEREPIEPEVVSAEIASARSKVRKLRDMGAFVFSSEAENALNEFVEFDIPEEHVSDPGDIYDPLSRIAKKSLQELITVSRKDLKITDNLL
jgi:hypothetical protein